MSEESAVLKSAISKFPACCLKIYRSKYVLVGTYELDKASGNRTGTIDVYDKDLKLLKTNNCYGAILDLQLSPFDNQLMITGHSTGNVMVWRICDDKTDLIEMICNIQVFSIDVLVTSLRFSPLETNLVLATSTSGETVTLNIETGSIEFNTEVIKKYYSEIETKYYEVQSKKEKVIEIEPMYMTGQHSLECWTGEFGHLQPLQNVVFTGGDDATIMAHDLRSHDAIWSNSRVHEAGVVAIKASTPTFRNNQPTSLITGSYDDKIRSFDLRMFGENDIYPGTNTPVLNKKEMDLNGGVWRFSECLDTSGNASDTNKLLVCCMYNGAKVISVNENLSDQDFFKEEHYLKTGHESMCYGGDWCPDYAITCSFYDNSIQKWIP